MSYQYLCLAARLSSLAHLPGHISVYKLLNVAAAILPFMKEVLRALPASFLFAFPTMVDH